ncbi:baseplate assembly protein [Haematospirillum jordaniae]|uniref:baseplate assembly protein n=2 Tax=Haematospirillum jordaniae TaxID=1549855 RepID=UPI0014332D25|nr:baseplate J/gp47 family protein [Haematospirillum jordaniae]NKD84516.1 baseplate assembly protein [Haematospirillum jordaniae]NKD90801.1 baseplate assembly protein [Haematospirillum jordaniae]
MRKEARYSAIDLSQLRPPDVVEQLDYESVLADMLAALRAYKNQNGEAIFTALVESDPALKILEVAAYREMIVRQRVNEAARSVMLAYATGTNLDHLGALPGVARKVLQAANPQAFPPTDAVLENDDDYRRRIQLSLEGFSSAGPTGAYIFHALSAAPGVKDVDAFSPAPGVVAVTVMSNDGDGTPGADLLAAVQERLSGESIRPLTDRVVVQAAKIRPYTIRARLLFHDGPDREAVLAHVRTMAEKFCHEHHRLGADITLSGLYAALHQAGVRKVELLAPTETISIDRVEAAWCTDVDILEGDTP